MLTAPAAEQASQALCYNVRYHFSHPFKKIHGATPLEYRRRKE